MDYKQLSNGIGPHDRVVTNVKIHDTKMAHGSHRTHRLMTSLCSRRNRLLSLGFIIFIFSLWILANSGIFSRTRTWSSISDQICKLDEIELQNDFDFDRFQGDWYGAFTKGMENKLLAYFLEFYDVKTKFILKKDGNYDLKSGIYPAVSDNYRPAMEMFVSLVSR